MKVIYNNQEIEIPDIDWEEEKAYETIKDDYNLEDTIELEKIDINGDNHE